MTVNWTQEPARSEQPENPHNALAWTLWGLSAVVIVTWAVCMALGVWWGGRVHLLLIVFGLLMIAHVIMGFRNVKYFVPLRLSGGWFGRWGRPRARIDHVVPAPTTAFDAGTMKDETNQPIATSEEILPGNDPKSGPGQRQPDVMP